MPRRGPVGLQQSPLAWGARAPVPQSTIVGGQPLDITSTLRVPQCSPRAQCLAPLWLLGSAAGAASASAPALTCACLRAPHVARSTTTCAQTPGVPSAKNLTSGPSAATALLLLLLPILRLWLRGPRETGSARLATKIAWMLRWRVETRSRPVLRAQLDIMHYIPLYHSLPSTIICIQHQGIVVH